MMNIDQQHPELQLSVIIVNYNSGIYALECIKSVLNQRDVPLEIIVIDNASQDNSIEQLTNEFHDQIHLITSEENLGFARANNLAATKACGDFLLLLNPDTILIDPYSLRTMIDKLSNSPHIGLITPLINEPRKAKQVTPRYQYPVIGSLQYTETFKHLPGKIAWVLGACMLFKHSVFKEIKGFDPDYFLYGEDVDICLRLRLKNYEIGYDDSVIITHIGGASEFGENTLDKWLRKKRGLYLFLTKHLDSRDIIKIAKREIFKSKLYLFGLYIKSLISINKEAVLNDKKHRLQATIIAAKEALKQFS